MLKIGDFSRLSRVSVRMLRYYDDAGLVKMHLEMDKEYIVATDFNILCSEMLKMVGGVFLIYTL